MTGREFYRFVNSPEGQGRYFIDMDDVVLGASETEARSFRTEQNHSYYIQTQEEGWSTLSLYAIEDKNECSGEEAVMDEARSIHHEERPCHSCGPDFRRFRSCFLPQKVPLLIAWTSPRAVHRGKVYCPFLRHRKEYFFLRF